MAFDVQAALKAGYSEGEIAEYLGQQQKFDAVAAMNSGYTPGEIIKHLTTEPKAAPFSLSDVGLAGAAATVGAGKAVLQAFGPETPGVQTLGEFQQSLLGMRTPERQAEVARRTALEERAAKTGTAAEEIGAFLGGIKEAPIQSIAQGVGSTVPALLTGAVALVAGAPLGIATAVGIGTRFLFGALQGAGEIKGSIYDNVYRELKAKNVPDAEAKAQAEAAQDYIGNNTDNIFVGAGLGALAGGTGAERILGNYVAKKIGVDLAAGAAKKEAEGLIMRGVKEALKEGIPEGLQGGQEQFASNVALAREGVETPEFQGVLGSAARDAAIGALTGTAVSPFGREKAPAPVAERPLEKLGVEQLTALRDQYMEAETELSRLAEAAKAPDLTPEQKTAAINAFIDYKNNTFAPLRAEFARYRTQIEALTPKPEVVTLPPEVPPTGEAPTPPAPPTAGVPPVAPTPGKPTSEPTIDQPSGEPPVDTNTPPPIAKGKKPTEPPAPPVEEPFDLPTPPEKREFQIDTPKEQIAKDVQGMTIPELARWAVINAPNTPARQFALKAFDRINQFADRGIFPGKIKVLNAGSRNEGGTRGHVRYRHYRDLKQGFDMSLMLNGIPNNGIADSKTGTQYSTILHELLHAATVLEVRFNPKSKPVKELKNLYARVKSQVTVDIKNGRQHPALDSIKNGANTMQSVDELIAWGLTDKNFQDYLSTIKVGEKTAFTKFVEIMRKLLNINPEFETALDSLMRSTENLLSTPVSQMEKGMGIKLKGAQIMKGATAPRVELPKAPEKPSEAVKPPAPPKPPEAEEPPAPPPKPPEAKEAKTEESISGFPTIDEVPRVPFGPSSIQPKGIAKGKPLYHETNVDGLDDLLRYDRQVAIHRRFVADNKDIAIGQGMNKGVMITFRPDSLSGRENVKPGTGDIAGREYQTDVVAPRAIASIEISQKDFNRLRGLTKRQLQDFDKTDLGKGRLLFTRKGLATEPVTVETEENVGSRAVDIINKLGTGVQPPGPTAFQKGKENIKNAFENPKMTVESARKATSGLLDKFETATFSSSAAFDNQLRRAVAGDIKDNAEVIGMLIDASQSQAVHADALASQFIIEGGIQYDPEVKKWVAYKEPDNFVELGKQTAAIAKKYNISEDEARRIAHTYFMSKRLKSLVERNAKDKERIEELKAERSEATTKAEKEKINREIERLKDREAYIHKDEPEIELGLSLGEMMPELKDVAKTWNGIRNNVRRVMVNSGLWTDEYADQMLDVIDYVPFYREEQLEEGKGPKEFVRGLQVAAKEHRFKGTDKPVNDILDNMVRWTQYAVNRAVRNDKSVRMIDAALNIEMIDGTKMAERVTEAKRGMNIVRIWRDGEQELYNMADPLFAQAFTGIQSVAIEPMNWFSKIANTLRDSIVLFPLFSVAQVPQDSFAAVFSSGLQPQYALRIPILAVKEFIRTLSKTSQTHEMLKKYGAVGVRDFNSTVIRDDAEIFAGLKAPPGVKGKLKEALQHIAMSADNAVRQAVYEASIQQGLSKAEAMEKAFEIINFRRRGTNKMLQLAGQTIPFFYAYLAAQRVAYNTLTGTGISPQDRSAALKTFAYTTASVMTLSLLYSMMNADDEDYKKTPAAIRDRMLMIPGSGGVGIPLRTDMFLFPKIIAEHTYLMLTQKGYEDAAKFRKSMASALGDALLSPTLVPQAIKPAVEMAFNYDFFQQRPILGQFEKQKEWSRQFNENTSELSKLFGKTGYVSPIMMDHFVRGFFGTTGGLALWFTNEAINKSNLLGVQPPEKTWREAVEAFPGTGSFLVKSNASALRTDFYDLRDRVSEAAATFADIKQRNPDAIKEFVEDEKRMAKLVVSKQVENVNKRLSQLRTQMDRIREIPSNQMSGTEKAEAIRNLKEVEETILKAINVPGMREKAKI